MDSGFFLQWCAFCTQVGPSLLLTEMLTQQCGILFVAQNIYRLNEMERRLLLTFISVAALSGGYCDSVILDSMQTSVLLVCSTWESGIGLCFDRSASIMHGP